MQDTNIPDNKVILTIYTPTYNREKLLPRLYNSLCKQTKKDFEWLIIDDGSSDNTKKIVEKWKDEKNIKIIYVFKENGGVHTARDLAYEIVNTELIWGVDSDDWLFENAVESVLNLWISKRSNDFCGIFAPVKDVAGIRPLIKYPNKESVSYQDLYYKYRAHGDQTIIIRSEKIKKLKKFPVFENETLVPESFKWIQLSSTEKFLILSSCTTYIEYQEDGYTKNSRNLYFKNLNGKLATYNQCMKDCVYFFYKVKFCIQYIATCLFLKNPHCVNSSTRPILTFFLYPVGLLYYKYLKKVHKSNA